MENAGHCSWRNVVSNWLAFRKKRSCTSGSGVERDGVQDGDRVTDEVTHRVVLGLRCPLALIPQVHGNDPEVTGKRLNEGAMTLRRPAIAPRMTNRGGPSPTLS